MTKGEHEKLQIVEEELSEKLTKEINDLFEGFCREHKCRINPVVFYAPAPIGQPVVASGVQFHCVTNERIEQMRQDQNPKIIQAPGRLVN